jgi:hypothetical protein
MNQESYFKSLCWTSSQALTRLSSMYIRKRMRRPQARLLVSCFRRLGLDLPLKPAERGSFWDESGEESYIKEHQLVGGTQVRSAIGISCLQSRAALSHSRLYPYVRPFWKSRTLHMHHTWSLADKAVGVVSCAPGRDPGWRSSGGGRRSCFNAEMWRVHCMWK